MSEVRNFLEKSKKENNFVSLYRDELETGEYSGFITTVGRELVVMEKENDYALDGYVAERISDISYYEVNDDNKFIKKILNGEKLYSSVASPKFIEGNSWQELLSGIQASYGGWLTAETSSEEGMCFFLGRIKGLDSNYLYLEAMDAFGKVMDVVTIPLQDLITVTFGGRYVEIYRKYM